VANFTKFDRAKKELTGGSNTMGIEELLLETAKKRGEKRGEKKAQAKAHADKLESARGLKKIGLLTDQQIAENLKLPVEVVEKL